MTYFGPQYAKGRLEVAVLSWAAKPSQNVGERFHLSLISHTWDTAPVISGGSTLTLPAGSYFAQCFCTVTRTSGGQNIKYQWNVDGQAQGVYGQSDFYNNIDNDVADVTFTLDQQGTLDLRMIGLSGTLPTVTSNARIVIWRTLPSSTAQAVL